MASQINNNTGIRINTRGLPGGPVVKNPPSNAGDSGWIPRRGTKMPHAGHLSLGATTTEPTCCNY